MIRSETVEERLQAAYRSMGVLTGAGPRCPTAGRLWSAMEGELPRDEALPLLNHVSTCPGCIAAWQLAKDLAGERRPAEASMARDRRPTLRWTLAAAAIVVLGLITLPTAFRPVDETGPAPIRAEPRSDILSAVDDSEPLRREQCVLSWSAPDEAASYRVDVTTETLDVVFSTTRLAAPEVRIPAADLDVVPRGGRILWRVEASLTDGSRITSATFSNTVE